MLSNKDLEILKKPFADDKVGVRIQQVSKTGSKASLILYAEHTAVADRIEEVDPSWQFNILDEKIYGTEPNQLMTVRASLQMKDVRRENIGEGSTPKAAYSDALKRCAMLFGIGRYLYESEIVWVDYNDSTDKFYAWTFADYKNKGRIRQPLAAAKPPTPGLKQAVGQSVSMRKREDIIDESDVFL